MRKLLTHELDESLAARLDRRISSLLDAPMGLPNGRGKRTRLTATNAQKLKLALIDAAGHAAVFAANESLPNRVRGRGRPPDNAVFIFIDDIVRACEAVGLKPGLRYVAGSESLPVRLYIELAPLLWPNRPKNPRRLFQRRRRHRSDLIRFKE
jgi:hypothetical protein